METITNLLDAKGCPLDRQRFTWKELVGKPISKLDDDAFTRVRIILMNGLETDALRFSHIAQRFNKALRVPLAKVRRIEQMQATMVNWLIGPDHSPIETTLAYEQVAIEVTAAVAQTEPDDYQAQTYRFGLLEDFDHLYRYTGLLDQVEGKDANAIIQGYTDIIPGRPLAQEHRAPEDDVRDNYDRHDAQLVTKIHAATITAAEYQTHDYYQNVGNLFADPVARRLYAEIAAIEEQHVTQYGSLADPDESLLEKWLIHEATEAYNYLACVQQEPNPRIKAIWERFLDYELGHLNYVCDLFKSVEQRDPAEIFGDGRLPKPIEFTSQREFVRETLRNELDLSARGRQFVARSEESEATREYRQHLNSQGSAGDFTTAGYRWAPGTELAPESG